MPRPANPSCPACHGIHVNVMTRQEEECPECYKGIATEQPLTTESQSATTERGKMNVGDSY